MTKKNKVSIIIPCYNGLPYIKETLDSVLAQTYQNLEIIIIDDGSTDGSLTYLNTISDSKIIVKSNKGKGACAARNYGIRLSTGEYIQFLDADDLLSPNKIEEQVQLLNTQIDAISVCSTVHFYDTIENCNIDEEFFINTSKPEDFLLELYGADGKRHGMVSQHAWLTPRTVIEKAGFWNESLFKDQDGEFFCRVVMSSKKVCYAPSVYSYYRKHLNHNTVSSGKTVKHLESQLRALKSKESVLSPFKERKDYKRAMALQYKFIAIDAYPQYATISKETLKMSNLYGGSNYVPVLGGKVIEAIKNIFGWKAAKKLSFVVHNNKIIAKLLR